MYRNSELYAHERTRDPFLNLAQRISDLKLSSSYILIENENTTQTLEAWLLLKSIDVLHIHSRLYTKATSKVLSKQ